MEQKENWISRTAHLYYYLAFIYYLRELLLALGILGVGANILFIFRQSYVLAGIGMTVSVLVLIAGFALFFAGLRRRYKAQNPGVKILSTEACYRVLGNDRYEYHRKSLIKARSDGIQNFSRKFTWTGVGGITASTSDPDIQLILTEDTKKATTKIDVRFSRPLKKGERREVEYVLHLVDAMKRARPFLSSTIKEDVNFLRLKVDLADRKGPHIFTRTLFMSSHSDIPIYEARVPSHHHASDEWVEKKPRIGFVYCINW